MDNKALAHKLDAFRRVSGVLSPGVGGGDVPVTLTEGQRILALPTWDEEAFKLDLTEKYRKPGGTQHLFPIQSKVLHFAEEGSGVLGHVGVGGGKTLLSLLLPVALKAQRPVVILPAPLVENFHRELRKFRLHWNVHERIRVITFSKLSIASGAQLLDSLGPDLIIIDEAHNLARPDSARTKRFLRYCRNFPNTTIIPMSGTMTKRSLRDYAHLAELALRQGAPVPLNSKDLITWGACIDADGKPKRSDFANFCEFLPSGRQNMDDDVLVEEGRDTFKKRLRSTRGVVCSSESAVNNSLVFTERPLQVPSPVRQALADLDATWCRPDGEELESALAKAAVEAQFACGFYYRWKWPQGKVDVEWMKARAAWHKAIRDILKHDNPEYDSPLRVAQAIHRGKITHAGTLQAYEGWGKVRDRPPPPTETVWLDGYMVEDAVAWGIERLDEGVPGIIWYEHTAVGQALAAKGIPTYGRGVEVPVDGTAPLVAASIRVHGTGKNLQHGFAKNLVLSMPAMGATVEQLVARTHRPLQKSDEVTFDYYAHTRQARLAIKRAYRDAVYQEASHGMKQKLLLATWANPSWMTEKDEDGKD